MIFLQQQYTKTLKNSIGKKHKQDKQTNTLVLYVKKRIPLGRNLKQYILLGRNLFSSIVLDTEFNSYCWYRFDNQQKLIGAKRLVQQLAFHLSIFQNKAKEPYPVYQNLRFVGHFRRLSHLSANEKKKCPTDWILFYLLYSYSIQTFNSRRFGYQTTFDHVLGTKQFFGK